MPKTGTADLPLRWGKAPRWLFARMALLAREVWLAIGTEFAAQELLRHFADPFWFESFGCVLGLDWHYSGLTTTVCGAPKARSTFYLLLATHQGSFRGSRFPQYHDCRMD